MTGNSLALSGPLTIALCEDHQSKLLAALERQGDVEVDVAPEIEADVAFVQLLVAAQRSATARGKRIRFAAPLGGALAAALKSCGFSFAANETGLDRIIALNAGGIG